MGCLRFAFACRFQILFGFVFIARNDCAVRDVPIDADRSSRLNSAQYFPDEQVNDLIPNLHRQGFASLAGEFLKESRVNRCCFRRVGEREFFNGFDFCDGFVDGGKFRLKYSQNSLRVATSPETQMWILPRGLNNAAMDSTSARSFATSSSPELPDKRRLTFE